MTNELKQAGVEYLEEKIVTLKAKLRRMDELRPQYQDAIAEYEKLVENIRQSVE